MRQIVYAGVQNTSFVAGRDDLLNLARLKISEKQVERVTERIGQERVEQRDAQAQAFLKLPVVEKFAAAVAHPPDVAVVEMDGGRLQIRKEPRSDPAIAAVPSPVKAEARPAAAAEPMLDQVVTEPAAAVEATPVPAVTEPAAAVEATPVPAAVEPAVVVKATPVPAVTEAAVAVEATPVPAVVEPAVAVEATPVPAVVEPVAAVKATPVPAVTEPAAAVEATPVPAVVEPAAAVKATPGPAVAEPAGSKTHNHWREDKIGLLMTMTSEESVEDPCPTIPETFVDPLRIIKLARELHKGCAPGEDAVADPADPEGDTPLECPEYTPPTVRVKSMVATRQDAESLGKTLAAAARARGFYGAKRKAFVADGAECNWTVQKRWFSDFVPIIDFIHVLSYVFAAAMAGRPFGLGWAVYVRWIGLVWQGRVAEVITELERRQEELGLPTKDESETSPRQVVADTLRYLKNNQDRMKYDEYRRLGLPMTSSHVESTVKQFNRRVKGTEKFWSEEGAEALLQLRADFLSETEPMEKFWQEREATATGRKCYRRAI